MVPPLAPFIEKWSRSSAAERANKDAFLIGLCDVLDVPGPDPTTGDAEQDRYVFEKDALTPHEGGVVTVGKIDLYKAGAFILEAKQGSAQGAKKLGTAKRETPAWHVAMQDAFGQAVGYARTIAEPVPFIIACDIGYCFDLYAAFDGTRDYRQFPNPQASRLFLRDLERHKDTLRQVFLDPLALDPARRAANVTRDVATHLAALARALEKAGHPQELVARFLMRCLFTMFAEDVGLLPDGLFTKALRDYWIPSPASFQSGIEHLWHTMNTGGHMLGALDKILRFNGGLFASPDALPLDRHALDLLAVAAGSNWSEVEPAIFGTLLERALDPKERHRLGAHYTPRAYVERLVRPTIEEPVRADWDVVQAEVRHLVKSAEEAGSDKAQKAKLKDAVAATRAFLKKLGALRVLDPACGTGNFLYVTLDLFKRIEGEVLALLESLGEKQTLLQLEAERVTPAQFHGIEVKPWAREIAELVLWIGYLQWHFRIHGKGKPVPEPVLRDYKNIECRDALLVWHGEPELVRDAQGKPVTRWDGETMKRSPVTGEDVPDERAQVPTYRYVNPRRAEWPEADFVVGNPPFIGAKRMRESLGDGYTAALRKAYQEVPDGTDYVVYWWVKAAGLLRSERLRKFGFITTNSITQSMNRKATEAALFSASTDGIVWAIPDHPWVDAANGAAVRIAMTVGGKKVGPARLVRVEAESPGSDEQVDVTLSSTAVPNIHSDLTGGAAVVAAMPLRANAGICSVGLVRFGEGFVLSEDSARKLEPAVVHRLVTGRDVNQSPLSRFVVDFYPMDEAEAREAAPLAFQHVLAHVRPGREQIRDRGSRERWWRFGRDKPKLRAAIAGIRRFIATSEVSKHRVFSFLPNTVRPDHTLNVVGSDDGLLLGILSSRIHSCWALAAGGTLEDRRRYNVRVCFDPFPFPVSTPPQAHRIRAVAESLDAHRKRQQAAHPKLTITAMYNVLEKLRAGEPLTDNDKTIHDQGLVSILKQLHDDLDAAVFDAYGWPGDLTDEQILERLVALNAERAEEEKRGLVRWLRPDFQAPRSRAPTQEPLPAVADADDGDDAPVAPAAQVSAAWPKKLPEQIAAIRELVRRPGRAWSAKEVAAAFKGAKPGAAELVLDSLAALGMLLAYDSRDGRRWRATAG
ncbi:MAG: class I SAM-dependent DNA methyltransferase [Polyangiaceae bacterium]|nr:class I SAM-dependent DNA methyltransferase [Polyangiaceae bacterium]